MHDFGSFCDEFYVNMTLNTELELPTNRDTLLHFFEQLQRRFPSMRNFYSRERSEFVLEEDKDGGSYRWCTTETKRVNSGFVNPPSLTEPNSLHDFILESIPYTLSISPLDCESLNYMLGFDFSYRGNHHDLLHEALGVVPAFERCLEIPGARLIANEPAFHFSLDDDCRTQCRISIEPRTSAYHIRTGEYPEEQLSVYLTLRRYGSLDTGQTYVEALEDLRGHAAGIMQDYMVDNVLLPLRNAIAIK